MTQPIILQLGGSFQFNDPVLGPSTNPTYPNLIDLPANQRLVIETISVHVGLANSQNAHSATISLAVGDAKSGVVSGEFNLPLVYQATYDPLANGNETYVRDWWSMIAAVRIYVPWGGRLALSGKRGPNSNGAGDVWVSLSGTLETLTLINFHWFPFQVT